MTDVQTLDFECLREVDVPEINATAREYRHGKTGARVLSILTEDTNKVFGISFRTPPEDSTGIAHILEHSVLCGSRKYPVKEPFVELLKGSLQTFLNAFTYPDKTCYPVASENLQDFYNLMDVYLDAVFYPRITRHVFEQEGWHYEKTSPDEPIAYKGVVFNEMKGAYSNPEDILGDLSQQSLFPDTPYGVDSGGDPKAIPDLTFEQFCTFHQTYYHPGNAYIYFYGDDDPEERLRRLAPYLDAFEPAEATPNIPLQAPFDRPVRRERPFDPGEAEAEEASKAMFTVNWLLPQVTDTDTNLALSVLGYALVGTPASPLRMALIESGLGEDLTGAGFANYIRQMYFSTGLRGVDPDNLDPAEALIHGTLQRLADDGIDRDTLAASLNTLEFRMRERNTGGYPRGLAYMISALNFWLYDADPLEPLRFEAPLARLREQFERGEPVFETLLRTHLIDNPHRATVVLRPAPGTSREEAEAEEAKLRAVEAGMSEADLQAVMENTQALKTEQETPDSAEDLARIPMLTRADVDPVKPPLPSEELEVEGAFTLLHDLPTSGIVYLDIGFPLDAVPDRLLHLVPLFAQAILEMGNEREDYAALSNRIGKDTGGIGGSTLINARHGGDTTTAWFFLRGKSTAAQAGALLDLAGDLLTGTVFSDRDRFRQIVLEERAGFESSVIPAGTAIASGRLKANYHLASWLNEQMKGVSYLLAVRDLLDRIDTEWDAVLEDLETVRRLIVQRGRTLLNVTTDADGWTATRPLLARCLDRLPTETPASAAWTPALVPCNEGLTIPAQVNYVTKGLNLFETGYTMHGSVFAACNLLRTGYLWDQVRVMGGAYGAFCSLDTRSGFFGFGSYRDPNLADTLGIYDRAGDFLRALPRDEAEITKSVLGAIGSIDAYQLPDAKGFTALIRHLAGEPESHRQQLRNQLLATTMDDIRAFADALDQVRDHGSVVVVGAGEAIEQSRDALGGDPTLTRIL